MLKQKLQTKLATAIEWAEIYLANVNIYFETKKEITDPIQKAESRLQYEDDFSNLHKELKKVRRYGKRLGYNQEEIDSIVERVYFKDIPKQPRRESVTDFQF